MTALVLVLGGLALVLGSGVVALALYGVEREDLGTVSEGCRRRLPEPEATRPLTPRVWS